MLAADSARPFPTARAASIGLADQARGQRAERALLGRHRAEARSVPAASVRLRGTHPPAYAQVLTIHGTRDPDARFAYRENPWIFIEKKTLRERKKVILRLHFVTREKAFKLFRTIPLNSTNR